jgi:hypothetical protein
MAFKKAVKSQAKLRAALFGPSGAGKTFTALEIAAGIISVIGGKIALIDSERSSASKYADRFEFDQVDLEVKDIDEYVHFIKEAADAGYTVLIIDSLTHAWQMLLDSVEKLAQAKYRGNTWSAWSEGTPEQRKLVDAIISFPGHIIVTMRSKTEWQTTTNDRGKTSPVRVGLAPEQGKGIEYEFDILFEISPDHLAHIIKDRSGKFQDKIIEKPGKKFGQELIAWLNEGAVPPPLNPANTEPPKPKTERQIVIDAIATTLKAINPDTFEFFTEEEKNKVKADIAKTKDITALKKLAADWENELKKRQKEYVPIPSGDDPASNETAPENRSAATETPTTAEETPPATASEKTETQEQATEDDGFVDDIPEMNEKPGRGKNPANAGASGELDIF